MKQPSKKEIKAAIEKLKKPSQGSSGGDQSSGKLEMPAKKNSQRIRKQGV